MLDETAQEGASPTKDFNLIFELSDPAIGFAQFTCLCSREILDLSAAYPILPHPAIEAGISDTKVFSRLRDALA